MHSLCKAGDVDHSDLHTSENTPHHGGIEKSYERRGAPTQTPVEPNRDLAATLRRESLPCELLCRIFSECARMDVCAPATVSHVCGCWRQAALGYRALWSRIELGRREKCLKRASIWAQRAGAMSLEFCFRYSEHTHRGGVIPWLQEHSGRIKWLSILNMHPRGENNLLPLLPGFARLETLRIIGLEDIDLDMGWIARLFEHSHLLNSLSLAGVSELRRPESLMGVAARLTHLSLGGHSHIDYHFPLRADAVLEVISACTGLHSLECHALTDQDGGDPPTVYLPFLTSLSVGDGPETCVILRYLHVPRLRSFRLVRGQILNEYEEEIEMPFVEESENDYMEFFMDCLRRLHETSDPQVTTVIWDGTGVDLCALNHCAPYLPAMEELICSGLKKVGELAPCGFLSLDTEAIPYPRLRSLFFTKCNLSHLRLDLAKAAIKKIRIPFSRRIMLLTVENCEGAKDRFSSPL